MMDVVVTTGSDVNKTKFLRPRPKYKTKTTAEVNKGTWRIFLLSN